MQPALKNGSEFGANSTSPFHVPWPYIFDRKRGLSRNRQTDRQTGRQVGRGKGREASASEPPRENGSEEGDRGREV